ncbi:MAG TPA: OmpA family protein [Alphaproteobacteria bacterium]
MQMYTRNTLAKLSATALAAVAMSSPATAEDMTYDSSGAYIFGSAGIHQTQRSKLSGGGLDTSVTHDPGFAALAGAGYDFGNIRLELEGGYRRADVDDVGGVDGNGRVRTYSVMGNVFYDLDFGGGFKPYIGGGLGAAHVRAKASAPVGPFAGIGIDDNSTRPALQGGAGVAIALAERLDLTIDYRYLFAGPWRLEFSTNAGQDVRTRLNDHAIFVGLRFSLNPPPAPPPPAPAPVAEPRPAPPAPPPPPAPQPQPPAAVEPEPVREFLVFFDWDRSDLTSEAREIIAAAATEAKRISPVRIVATGHADRSGPSPYNVGLSQRRADSVKAELIRQGISANEIATIARGETDPLVSTADGVREPRNRRVLIVLE